MGIFLALNAEATMISFFVIETGLPQEGGKNMHSLQWENALLDVFFEAGYIVSNAPIIRLERKPSGDIQTAAIQDMNEAKAGGANYFIIAHLDYNADSSSPREISLVLYSGTPYRKIFENKVTGKTYKTEREELDDLKVIAGTLVPYLRNQ